MSRLAVTVGVRALVVRGIPARRVDVRGPNEGPPILRIDQAGESVAEIVSIELQQPDERATEARGPRRFQNIVNRLLMLQKPMDRAFQSA
jgi:hypothetical protein